MRAKPLHSSPVSPGRANDRVGTLGLTRMGERPMPFQRQVWRLLEARAAGGVQPRYPFAVVSVPRRAGKTDAIFALCIGRCETRPDYQIAYAAQSGSKSRERFYSLLRMVHVHGVGPVPWRERLSRGEERIEWANGSVMRFVPPKADNFRGDALDMAVLDEAQLHDDMDSADLLGSLLPVFWTRPDATLLVAGTAGSSRDGMLWQALAHGREGAGGWGILEYALPDELDGDDEGNWLLAHPGPAGVTEKRALEVLRLAHAQLGPEEFGREVLGRWPEVSLTAVFPAGTWDALGVATEPAQPRRFGLAFETTSDGERAVVTATWRQGGLTWGGVLREDAGIGWVPGFVASLAVRNRLPCWFDSTPNNNAVASLIARDHRGVATHACTAVEYASGCALLHAAVSEGTFRHTRQPELDGAVAVAAKRVLVDGGWAWGRKASTGHIHPLVSLSVGLRAFDTLPVQRITRALTARAR